MQIIYDRTLNTSVYGYVSGRSHVGQHAGIVWSTWGIRADSVYAGQYCGLLFGPTHPLYRRCIPVQLAHDIGADNATVGSWSSIPGTHTPLHVLFWCVSGIPVLGMPKSLSGYCVNLCNIVNAYQT